MQLLTENFHLFSLLGFWMPEKFRGSKFKSLAYNVYTATIFSLAMAMVLMKIVNVSRGLKSLQNAEECAILVLGLPEYICFVCKAIIIHRKRKEILDIERILLRCRNVNDEGEEAIQAHYDEFCRLLVVRFGRWAFCTAIPLELKFLINDKWDLLLEGFNVYEISTRRIFWITYLHQTVTISIGMLTTMNFDTFFAGYILQICAQLDVLKYNLSKIHTIDGELQYRAIVKCVERHITCRKLVEMTQQLFNSAFVIQICMITPPIATYFYTFMKGKPGDQYHFFFLLTLTFELLQFLFYCWFGHEITLKSSQLSNVIFQSRWSRMSKKSQRALLMLMANRPIVYKMGYMIRLSIATFSGLLRNIYSAYSMLAKVM